MFFIKRIRIFICYKFIENVGYKYDTEREKEFLFNIIKFIIIYIIIYLLCWRYFIDYMFLIKRIRIFICYKFIKDIKIGYKNGMCYWSIILFVCVTLKIF